MTSSISRMPSRSKKTRPGGSYVAVGWHAEQVGVERGRALEVLGPLGHLHESPAAIMAVSDVISARLRVGRASAASGFM